MQMQLLFWLGIIKFQYNNEINVVSLKSIKIEVTIRNEKIGSTWLTTTVDQIIERSVLSTSYIKLLLDSLV